MRAILWNSLDRLSRLIHRQKLGVPSERETALARDMRERVAALPPIDETADTWWRECARTFRREMSGEDPRAFTRWPVVSDTMFLGNRRQAIVAWNYLKRMPDFHARWVPALDEAPAGAPTRLLWSGRTSGLMVWHALGVVTFERLSRMRLDQQELIIEFGGGYGSMCRLARHLGFRGRYLIYDLPELTILQRYYLQSVDIQVIDEAAWLSGSEGVLLVSGIDSLNRVLGATTSLERALFWASWSFSEAPVALRQQVEPYLKRMGACFVAYQGQGAGADNNAYFTEWQKRTSPPWRYAIEPVPNSGSNYYLVGVHELPPGMSSSAP